MLYSRLGSDAYGNSYWPFLVCMIFVSFFSDSIFYLTFSPFTMLLVALITITPSLINALIHGLADFDLLGRLGDYVRYFWVRLLVLSTIISTLTITLTLIGLYAPILASTIFGLPGFSLPGSVLATAGLSLFVSGAAVLGAFSIGYMLYSIVKALFFSNDDDPPSWPQDIGPSLRFEPSQFTSHRFNWTPFLPRHEYARSESIHSEPDENLISRFAAWTASDLYLPSDAPRIPTAAEIAQAQAPSNANEARARELIAQGKLSDQQLDALNFKDPIFSEVMLHPVRVLVHADFRSNGAVHLIDRESTHRFENTTVSGLFRTEGGTAARDPLDRTLIRDKTHLTQAQIADRSSFLQVGDVIRDYQFERCIAAELGNNDDLATRQARIDESRTRTPAPRPR